MAEVTPMKRYYIVGLSVQDAQGYAMRCKQEHKGHRVTVLSVESVKNGALHGIGSDDVEVIVLPRAWSHRDAITLGLSVEALEERGVRVTTPRRV